MITQEEVLVRLEEEGYTTSKRNLGYWRGVGLLPPLQREGQQYYWKEEILDKVKFLCKKQESLTIIELEGDRFTVERVEIKRINGEPTVIMYLNDGQFILRKARESVLDAITTI